jgi:uncharacterized protein YjbK
MVKKGEIIIYNYNLEIETKFLVKKENFYEKMNLLYSDNSGVNKIDSKIIINYYYDTSSMNLSEQGDTLRIRQFDRTLTLQYKKFKKIEENKRICNEFSFPIKKLPKTILNSNLSSKLPNIKNINEVYVYVGNTTVERKIFEFKGIKIFFDKNYYLGNIDYELEIESLDNSKIIEFKKKLNLEINFNREIKSKYKRFLEAYLNFK